MAVCATGAPRVPDVAYLAREDEASTDDIMQRTAATEDLVCFVSFLSLEDEPVLGLGLHVYAHTWRQRQYGLAPSLEFVHDYVDVEAFNEGVRRAATPSPTSVAAGELPAMVSSARGRLNGWLPLYVNAEHWARAVRYAPSAFARLAGGNTSTSFQPDDALNVCCSLLTCVVSGFTVGQMDPTCASPRTAKRSNANERAVQMYADVHRLFLQMAREYPAIQQAALKQLQGFIQDPAMRMHNHAPSLGNLVQCLLITEEVSWEELAPSIIPEALRRHVIRQDLKGEWFDSRCCSPSVEDLISAWDKFAPQAGMVLCFSALFCRFVGRPNGCSLNDIEANYDRCWGRVRSETMMNVTDICDHLCRQHSVMDFLPLILHDTYDNLGELFLWADNKGRQRTIDIGAELLLWAEKYGRNGWPAVAIPADQWPQLRGTCPLLRKWQEVGLNRKRMSMGRRPVQRQRLRRSGPRQQRRYEQFWQSETWFYEEQQHEQYLQTMSAPGVWELHGHQFQTTSALQASDTWHDDEEELSALYAWEYDVQTDWFQSMQLHMMDGEYLYPQHAEIMPR